MAENTSKRVVLASLFWKFGEQILTQGISFIISVVLARVLMPAEYGIIALAQVFIALANVFITSGFSTALIQKKDAESKDFSTMFFCSLICSALLYAILFFSAPLAARIYKEPVLTDVLRVLALQIPLGVYHSIQVAYISRHMLFRKHFFVSLINAALSGAVGIGMAFGGFGVWALVSQTIAGTIISTVLLFFVLPWRPRLEFSKTSAKSLMKYGSRVLGADLSGTFFNELRSLIIGGAYSTADLAFYNKGRHMPALLTNNLSGTLMSVLFPAFANQSDDLGQVKQMVKRSLRLLSYILVPCLFGLAAVMEPLVLLLYTEKWAASVPFGQVLSIGLCVGVLGTVSLQMLKAIGRSDVVLKLEFYKKPVYVLLLIVGVSVDVYAIAVTMALYDVYGVFINMLQMRKYLNYGLREQFRDLAPAFLLAGGMTLIVLLIPAFESLLLTLTVKVLAGVAVYVGGSILFKVESYIYLKQLLFNMLRR